MAVVLASALYFVVVAGFRVSGHWQTELQDPEYQHRIQEINSPIYEHVGGDR